MERKGCRWGLLWWMVGPAAAVGILINYLTTTTAGVGYRDDVEVQEAAKVVDPREPRRRVKWQKGEGLVTIWFDDAWRSQYEIGFKEMKKRGLVGVLAVPTKLIGSPAYMNWSQVRRVRYEGWDIASHSRNHYCDEKVLTKEMIEQELAMSKEDLLAQGLRAQHFVAPCGLIVEGMEEIASRIYETMRTSYSGSVSLPVVNRYMIPIRVMTVSTTIEEVQTWIKEAKAKGLWLNLVFHQIEQEGGEYKVSEKLLIETLELVKNSGLRVVSLEEVPGI